MWRTILRCRCGKRLGVESDLVEDLLTFAFVIDETQGRANVVMLSGDLFRQAAEEVIRLRQENLSLSQKLVSGS